MKEIQFKPRMIRKIEPGEAYARERDLAAERAIWDSALRMKRKKRQWTEVDDNYIPFRR